MGELDDLKDPAEEPEEPQDPPPEGDTGAPAEKPSEEPAASESEGDPEPKEPEQIPYSRFKEVYAKQKQLERDAQYWRDQAFRQQQSQQQQSQQEQQSSQQDSLSGFNKPKPRYEDFEDETQFYEALSDWKWEYRDAEKQAKVRQQEQQQRIESFQDKISKGPEKYEDFNEVGFLPGNTPASDAIIEALTDSDYAADIVYWFGKNLDEAARIANMSSASAAREVGKLEARFANAPATPKKKTESAPEPTKPVGGKEPPPKKSEEEMTMDEWYAAYEAGDL